MIQVHVWVMFLGGILCASLGALAMAWKVNTETVSRVARVEGRVDNLESVVETEIRRNDERIDNVRKAVADAMDVFKDAMGHVSEQVVEVLKQNTVLIAEIRAERKNHAQ